MSSINDFRSKGARLFGQLQAKQVRNRQMEDSPVV
jgi:hypothetical protein